ncbi:exodeoxyribonuclease V subunit alpha [Leptospira perolatii]|uniref:Exodeoxyribonuclease V subunit alpha n=1 Tax=Leptospira perolatii TaxID=2023191 RepID=A0A2M9ZP11_9LEPT|nr:exodeoxyribonuclease V subunit alpha [Leptospira perolatii]PJZ70618.1 exodeoxyribonuclease V subunit alpha [Leptospira perolatii]PJZ73830.1 exodeoxyribonuclease V subunit alpha [Leptospira perolatii]
MISSNPIVDPLYVEFLTKGMLPYCKGISEKDLHDTNVTLLSSLRLGNLSVPIEELKTKSLLSLENPFFRERNKLLYYRKPYESLVNLEVAIKSLLSKKIPESQSKRIESVVKEVTEKFPLSLKTSSGEIHLCAEGEQRDALVEALKNPFFVLTGGPGTGKTTVVTSLLRALVRLGYPSSKIGLAAPTGRAAQRLKESLDHTLGYLENIQPIDASLKELNPFTIHRLLGYNPSKRSFKYGTDSKLPYEILILDEVSMVDLYLMNSILESISSKESFRLILLGDPNQLPSVAAGAVLSDLVYQIRKGFPGNGIQLQISRRQEGEASSIFNLAQSCLEAESEKEIALALQDCSKQSLRLQEILPYSKGGDFGFGQMPERTGFFRINGKLPENLDEFLVRYFWSKLLENIHTVSKISQNSERLKEYLTVEIHNTKILTVLRKGQFGSEGLNARLCELILKEQRLPTISVGNRIYFSGLPLLITENDKERELFNGDTGIVAEIKTGAEGKELRALFSVGGVLRDFALDTLPDHEYAFAITVHKSQGSEYDQVFLILPPDATSDQDTEKGSQLYCKEILYTALTRAKKSVYLLAGEKRLKQSLENRSIRTTGFTVC